MEYICSISQGSNSFAGSFHRSWTMSLSSASPGPQKRWHHTKKSVADKAERNHERDDSGDNFNDQRETSAPQHATSQHGLNKDEVERLKLRDSYPEKGESTGHSRNLGNKGKRKDLSDFYRDRRLAGGGLTTGNFQAMRQDGSLLEIFYRDFCGLLEEVYALRRPIYSLLKWPLLTYLLWLIVSHAVMFCVDSISRSAQSYCEKPTIERMIPLFCRYLSGLSNNTGSDPTENFALSQERLDSVLDLTDQNRQQAGDMFGNAFAVRDLRVRIRASKLDQKEGLLLDLNVLVDDTDAATE